MKGQASWNWSFFGFAFYFPGRQIIALCRHPVHLQIPCSLTLVIFSPKWRHKKFSAENFYKEDSHRGENGGTDIDVLTVMTELQELMTLVGPFKFSSFYDSVVLWHWERFGLDVRWKFFSPRGCLGTETGAPGQWPQPQTWQSSGNVWTMLSDTWWDCWAVRGQELDSVILVDPFWLAYSVILWYLPLLGTGIELCQVPGASGLSLHRTAFPSVHSHPVWAPALGKLPGKLLLDKEPPEIVGFCRAANNPYYLGFWCLSLSPPQSHTGLFPVGTGHSSTYIRSPWGVSQFYCSLMVSSQSGISLLSPFHPLSMLSKQVSVQKLLHIYRD